MAFPHRRALRAEVIRAAIRHACTGAQNVLFERFFYENDHFTKTGSGQTLRKLKKSTFFLERLVFSTLPMLVPSQYW